MFDILKRYPKIWLCIAGIIIAILLVVFFPERERGNFNTYEETFRTLYIHTDENGCQYISNGNGMTSRMDINGKQICVIRGVH